MNYGTRKDEHNKLFDKFVYEMFVGVETKSHHKSPASLWKKEPKNSKFLSKPTNRKLKNEPSNEMLPMQRSGNKK